MENSLSNINSNSWKIALAIAIAIVPKKAIAIAVSILLLKSGFWDIFCSWMAITFLKIVNRTNRQIPYITSIKNVDRTLARVESLGRVAGAEVATGGVDFGGCLEERAPRWIP